MLEPHAPLAALYGVAGSWTTLCDARGEPRRVDRDEALTYLTTWCQMGATDLETSRRALRPLVDAHSFEIRIAARADLIDIVARQPVPADDVLRWMRTNWLADPAELDALVATYLELGREIDARIVAREQIYFPQDLSCRSLYRASTLLDRPDLRPIVARRAAADPTCAQLAARMAEEHARRTCPLLGVARTASEGCSTTDCKVLDRELASCGSLASSPQARLDLAYRHWPSLEVRERAWLAYVRFVVPAIGEPGAATLASAALENAALVADCGDLHALLGLASTVAARVSVQPASLAYVLTLTQPSCERRFSPTLDR